ncbi:DUF4762 family protein [Serratia fonticola]|nr:DUF4762 family protein [Serratia fonticola]MBL5863660.1 DUF4762 family protein [Serratia fonticola]MBL5902731.1 DUF4762 family protein [Serratia fonticola]
MKKLNCSEASKIVGGHRYICTTHYEQRSPGNCFRVEHCKDKFGYGEDIAHSRVSCENPQ